MDIRRNGFVRQKGYLDDSRRTAWLDTLFRRSDLWTERMGFHVMGPAWYADIETGNLASYHVLAEERCRMVRELFPGLVEMLQGTARFLPRELPVRARSETLGPFWGEAALVLLGAEKAAGGVWHADLEGLAPYPQALLDESSQAFSAVMVLQAPAAGGSLIVCPGHRALGPRIVEETKVLDDKSVPISIADGDLLLFDSFFLHRIDAFEVSPERSHRVTAVTHFLLRHEPFPHWEYWF